MVVGEGRPSKCDNHGNVINRGLDTGCPALPQTCHGSVRMLFYPRGTALRGRAVAKSVILTFVKKGNVGLSSTEEMASNDLAAVRCCCVDSCGYSGVRFWLSISILEDLLPSLWFSFPVLGVPQESVLGLVLFNLFTKD